MLLAYMSIYFYCRSKSRNTLISQLCVLTPEFQQYDIVGQSLIAQRLIEQRFVGQRLRN